MQPIDKTIQSEAPSFEELFADEETGTGLEHLFNRKFLAEATPAPQPRPAKEDPWADLSVAFTKPTPRITLEPESEPEPERELMPHEPPVVLDPSAFEDVVHAPMLDSSLLGDDVEEPEEHHEQQAEPEQQDHQDQEQEDLQDPRLWADDAEQVVPVSAYIPDAYVPEAYVPEPEPVEAPPASDEPASDEPVWQPPAVARPQVSEQPVAELAAEPAQVKIGEVITVFGCRGGCGATTVAVNLAGSLAAQGKEVCIVDLDVQLGDVLVTLDLDVGSAASIVNLSRDVHNLDPSVLKRRLVRHDSGAYVLAQGGRLEEIDESLPAKIPDLLSALARHFDVIVIDGVDDFSELALSAIDAADSVALVLTQDVLAVRRARRVIDICRQLEVPDHKIRPVINCYRKRSKIDRESISAGLRINVFATVVEDERTTQRSQDAGQLLHEMARRKRVTRDVAALETLTSGTKSAPVAVPAEEELPEPEELPPLEDQP